MEPAPRRVRPLMTDDPHVPDLLADEPIKFRGRGSTLRSPLRARGDLDRRIVARRKGYACSVRPIRLLRPPLDARARSPSPSPLCRTPSRRSASTSPGVAGASAACPSSQAYFVLFITRIVLKALPRTSCRSRRVRQRDVAPLAAQTRHLYRRASADGARDADGLIVRLHVPALVAAIVAVYGAGIVSMLDTASPAIVHDPRLERVAIRIAARAGTRPPDLDPRPSL